MSLMPLINLICKSTNTPFLILKRARNELSDKTLGILLSGILHKGGKERID